MLALRLSRLPSASEMRHDSIAFDEPVATARLPHPHKDMICSVPNTTSIVALCPLVCYKFCFRR